MIRLSQQLANPFKTSLRNIMKYQFGEQQILTSPTVRMIAKQNSIDLRQVQGTGKRGRVLKSDLILFIENPSKFRKLQKVVAQSQYKTPTQEPIVIKMNEKQKKLLKMRKMNVDVPHLHYQEQYEISHLNSIIENFNKKGKSLTLTSFLLKTFSLALKQHPKINTTYQPSHLYQYNLHQNHHITIGMDSSQGMKYPSINFIEQFNIIQIEQHLKYFKQNNEEKEIEGNITFIDFGQIGGLSISSLVSPNQTCAVSIGRMIEKPQLNQGKINKKKYVTVNFGCDHRVIDGGSIAKFANSWKQLVENPYIAIAAMQ